ncbi:T9SS type A sorting domain-containing protein [Flavobacterium jejuense]|uniref:T9SS type A sorting domain-containing protein n=1 Tax=Flavobacterium jejuense TaxID=1544455 RepID=A0ABX0IVS8_9FLAO|nr:T9SS type A sorting domain-containing protein [Flavobacterium jejuense]NHN27573.1 T9SS type A sorting domain-containing protein [Flavobacterium jejuense]
MRKFYIIVCLFVLFFSNAQDYNNNWVLGNSNVAFDTSSPTSSAISNSNKYGFASVSDSNGDLLFYSDGCKIYDRTFQVMQNGVMLYGLGVDYNRVQPVVIVPFPDNPLKYYVFISYIETVLSNKNALNRAYAPLVNYYYYIVDFSDSSYPNGKMTYPTQGFELYINASPNYFGPLTVVKNASNDGYFVIIHTNPSSSYGGELRAYKITSSGIDLSPVVTSLSNDIGYENFSDDLLMSSTKSIMRFGSNNTRFGELVITNTFFQGPNTSGSSSSFFTMDFNNTTGVFSNFQMIESDFSPSYNDFEFSDDSEKVYFVNNNVFVKDLTNLSLPYRKLSEFNNSSLFPTAYHIQRDKNENLAISNVNSNFLYKINTADSYANSAIDINYVTMNSTLISHFLPQFISSFTSTCDQSLVLNSEPNLNFTYINYANITTQNSYNLSSNNNIGMFASDFILLKPGTRINSGATYLARILPCNVNSARISDRKVDLQNDFEKEAKKILLYPNPNNGLFSINLPVSERKSILDLYIFDIAGKVIYQNKYKDQEITISLQNIEKGIYFVKLISEETNFIFEEKFIKN